MSSVFLREVHRESDLLRRRNRRPSGEGIVQLIESSPAEACERAARPSCEFTDEPRTSGAAPGVRAELDADSLERAASIDRLPDDILLALYEFVFTPARSANAARVAAALPSWIEDHPSASTELRRILKLGYAGSFDPADSAHRAALLPPEGLRHLSWRIGLALAADRLCRLIARSDLVDIGDALSPADWDFVFSPKHWIASDIDIFASTPAAALPSACRDLGWAVLEAGSNAMPMEVGMRMRLKLPEVKHPLPLSCERCKQWISGLYSTAAREWNSAWDACADAVAA
jgi:hypothetical protein